MTVLSRVIRLDAAVRFVYSVRLHHEVDSGKRNCLKWGVNCVSLIDCPVTEP
jgi:hypothetical protein